MSTDIISKKLRYELREHLVGWGTLRSIEMEFDSADISLSAIEPQESGARRSLIEKYYASLDFTKWEDAKKFLKVLENILNETYPTAAADARTGLVKWLQKDGFSFENGVVESTSRTGILNQAKTVATEFNADQMAIQIKRIEGAVETDPALAIGSAKELLETACRTILKETGIKDYETLDVPQLVRATMKQLDLLPDGVHEKAKGAEIIKRLLSNLGSVGHGIAELRNLYGSGHGKDGKFTGLKPRHARLAVGAVTTLAIFLFDTHRERSR